MQANESLLIARQLIGREEQRAQLAAHHVCLRTQRGIPPQYLAGQSSILLADTAGSMVTSQGLVQALRQAVVVQIGINVLALRVQLDQLVLTRLHLEQGYPHAIQYACHHLLMTAARLDHHLGLHSGKITGCYAYPIPLQQAGALRHVHRKFVGVSLRHPAQIRHLLIQEVREIGRTPGRDTGKEIIQGECLLHAENFLYRRTDKHVVEQQRSPRVDQLATHLSHLHVRGGEILEKSLSPTFPPGKLHVQAFGGADPVTPSTRGGRKREHVPAHGFQVMTLAGLCQAPLRTVVSQNTRRHDSLFPKIYEEFPSD